MSGGNAYRMETMAGQENEADENCRRVRSSASIQS